MTSTLATSQIDKKNHYLNGIKLFSWVNNCILEFSLSLKIGLNRKFYLFFSPCVLLGVLGRFMPSLTKWENRHLCSYLFTLSTWEIVKWRIRDIYTQFENLRELEQFPRIFFKSYNIFLVKLPEVLHTHVTICHICLHSLHVPTIHSCPC